MNGAGGHINMLEDHMGEVGGHINMLQDDKKLP